MAFLYCAYSLGLNLRSDIEEGQLYLFKFGHAGTRDGLLSRLNAGWAPRHSWIQHGDNAKRVSVKLGLCDDWKIIGTWDHSGKPGKADTLIHQIMSKISSPVRVIEGLKSHIRRADPRANLNGLTDIRCVSLEIMKQANPELWQSFEQNWYSPEAMNYVYGYVSGFIQGQLASNAFDGSNNLGKCMI